MPVQYVIQCKINQSYEKSMSQETYIQELFRNTFHTRMSCTTLPQQTSWNEIQNSNGTQTCSDYFLVHIWPGSIWQFLKLPKWLSHKLIFSSSLAEETLVNRRKASDYSVIFANFKKEKKMKKKNEKKN